ncbi:C-type lectin domain family 2 member H-like isoform X1 [Equus przewalskii]|uniref:C-type lectin domain family 2 member H-like isoform X1 n=1 Tax=Equus przewalskii TaxID=9798 RepID=A0ABM2FD31_EQUPR|nr:C-type lectin domain family 2 member H isoform X1 [Equus caballus]XP_008535717.1 PREDICTED: C-type lectin domain family 2 member H-like isoform X1 [Equus przewalskii]
MTEASPKVLQTDLIFRDGMEDAESGKTLQRKCAAIIPPVTLAKIYCCFSLIAVLTASVIVLSILLAVGQATSVLEVPVSVGCPKQWIGFGSKCFYFSEDARNWTFSQAFCVSLEADLVQFETLEELNFLKRYKGPSDHWIGLSRESSYHIWKWTDDSEYNASYVIKGVGECAYLNDNGISSARTYTDRKWICSKPNDIYRCQKSPNPF